MAGESGRDQGDHLAEVLENQRISGNMTDIIVMCEGKEFPAHKMVLCAASLYFETLLKPEWSDKKGRIELSSVTAKEIEIILPFLYTGKVKTVNDPNLMKKLLTTSHMMQIDGLFEDCYKKLCNDLDCDNCLEIYNLACLYTHSEMTELVVAFLAKHFKLVSMCEEFKQLSPVQLLKIIQNVVINDDVVEGLLKWAEVEESRQNSLLDIFTSSDLQNVTTRYLMKLIKERTLVRKHLHILTILNVEATTRTYFENILEDKLICCGSRGDRHVCRMFDIKQNRWLAPKILPFTLERGMTTVSFGEHVYFVGGGEYPSYTPSTQVIKYNQATNSVVFEGKLSKSVHCAGLGVLLSSIYVVNGWNETTDPVRTVQRYNPATNTCEGVAYTNNARFQPTVLTFSNYLYVVDSQHGENGVERYDHETNTWTIITNIPGKVDNCSAAIFRGRLFVNPSSMSNQLQVYDFTSNSWAAMKIEGLTENIHDLYSTVLDGKSVLLICDIDKVVHFYDDENKQLLRKSEANDQPLYWYKTCVIKL